MRHSLVKGMIPHGRTDPGYNVCLTVVLILRICWTWWLAKPVVVTSPSRVMAQALHSMTNGNVICVVKWRSQNTPGPVDVIFRICLRFIRPWSMTMVIMVIFGIVVPSMYRPFPGMRIPTMRMTCLKGWRPTMPNQCPLFTRPRGIIVTNLGCCLWTILFPLKYPTYAKRGFRSLHDMGYLVEVYTWYIIDMLVIGKCSVCPRETHGMEVCPHGNYIGSSGWMEVHIAKTRMVVALSLRRCVLTMLECQSRILAAFHHHSAHVFSPHRRDCPPGEGSWCKYQKALARGEDPSRAIQEPGIFSAFPLDARKEEKIYSDLSDAFLLEKCQKDHTQNIKSLHSKLWSKVAKHKYHGHERIVFLARVTTFDHNFGIEKGSLFRSLGVGTSDECLWVLRFQDSESFRVASRNPRPRQQSEAEDADPYYAAVNMTEACFV
ncbi:hypothetical protein C7M84_011637 [Penaeus vannamei]|uniref:Uncharacterized protein n=1 Tax=Penaeus vannamei TaxID=6689 RepID=A0A3R7M8P8_PENVA|nr:hypothetical protein C7M84_011637 [Penaeus vannamei]